MSDSLKILEITLITELLKTQNPAHIGMCRTSKLINPILVL